MNQLFQTPNYLAPILIVTFEFDASQPAVYAAWTDVTIFEKWFCPTGFSVALAEVVPKAGGYFRVHMKSPEGEIYPTKGEYILLEQPNRIVYKDSWDDDRENNQPVIAEVLLESIGAKTRLSLYSSFATEKQKEETLKSGIVDGWKMFFENLNTVLKG